MKRRTSAPSRASESAKARRWVAFLAVDSALLAGIAWFMLQPEDPEREAAAFAERCRPGVAEADRRMRRRDYPGAVAQFETLAALQEELSPEARRIWIRDGKDFRRELENAKVLREFSG